MFHPITTKAMIRPKKQRIESNDYGIYHLHKVLIEFIIEEGAAETSLRCPDCLVYADEIVEDARTYASVYYGYSSNDKYVDYDTDNYGFSDSY